jgi:transposase-like protein
MGGRILVKRKKHAPEQIVRKLREAEMELAKGAVVADVSRKLGVSEQTYYRWKQQFGGGQADQQIRVKELERQNARLKKIVADQAMDIDALKEIASKKW